MLHRAVVALAIVCGFAAGQISNTDLQAAEFLANGVGTYVPEGWSLVVVSSGKAGFCNHAEKQIEINAGAWDESYDFDAPVYSRSSSFTKCCTPSPDTPYSEGVCDELEIQALTSSAACLIAAEAVRGSAAQQNMCKFIKDHALGDPTDPSTGFNGTRAQAAWGSNGCNALYGPFPTATSCDPAVSGLVASWLGSNARRLS